MNILTPYLAASYPALCVQTVEEERFLLDILRDAAGEGRKVLVIAAVGGLRAAKVSDLGVSYTPVDEKAGYPAAFSYASRQEQVLLVVHDWHHIARNAAAYRPLKDAMAGLRGRGSCVILVAPSWSLPPELEHDIPVLVYALPTREELAAGMDAVVRAAGLSAPAEEVREHTLDAAAGLTLQEAEGAMALGYATTGRIDPARVEAEKMGLVRQSGYLEVSPIADPSSLGGLDGLRAYLEDEVVPSWHNRTLRVRGVLMCGPAGTGKSLASRTVGAYLGCPVLRMDMGALKASHVGESEGRMRAALALADAVSPCVLWIDEIEKGVAGHASSAHTDSGVTLAMVGTLLVWQQTHETPVIVVATCNDYSKLPPELTRAGRFDQKFFVDLPTRSERVDIARIHLTRFSPESVSDVMACQVADLTPDWTGAEIEDLVKSAARRTQQQVDLTSLQVAATTIRPISVVRADEVSALRKWGQETLRRANSPDDNVVVTRRRLTTTAN